jgi:hypothetical protein
MMQTTAIAASPGPSLDPFDVLERLLQFCRESPRQGKPVSREARARRLLARLWVEGEWERLTRERNSPLAEDTGRLSYEEAQAAHNLKLFALQLGRTIHRVLGPLASLDDPEWVPAGGAFEAFQRQATASASEDETVEALKARMFIEMQGARPDLMLQARDHAGN